MDVPVASKPSKYRNVKTVVDNLTFDSQKEANRYVELKLLQAAGEIHPDLAKALRDCRAALYRESPRERRTGAYRELAG